MLSVTFNQPIIIDGANLHSLLSLANTPAVVTSYATPEPPAAPKRTRSPSTGAPAASGDKPKRTRATKAEMEARKAAAAGTPAPEPEPAPDPVPDVLETTKAVVEEEKKEAAKAPAPKRDRRSAAKKAEDAAKEAKPSTGTGKTTTKGKAAAPKGDSDLTPEALLARFAKVIDADFDKATGLLGEFGVKRFSEMKEAEYPAFDAKLKELGE